MDQAAEDKLDKLNSGYEQVAGEAPNHFFCPILYRDEDVELCKAHIVNQAFPDSDRTWTIQRKDVDGRFGTLFERDFVKLQYRGKLDALDVLTDEQLAKKLRPEFRLGGKKVEHFPPNKRIPSEFSPISVEGADKTIRLALKLSPDETLASLEKQWQVQYEADLRLAALVTLLKSAHLTLFEIMGYEYALSAGGYFLGKTILGEYYSGTQDMERSHAIQAAIDHFSQFVNLVRPALSAPDELKGTLTDGYTYLCMQGNAPWAMMVLVRTGEFLHTVLVPVIEEPERAARFLRFLDDPPEFIEGSLGRFAGDHWDVSSEPTQFRWPEPNFDAAL